MANQPIPAATATEDKAKSRQRWLARRWESPRFAAVCLGFLSLPFAAASIAWSSVPRFSVRETAEPVSFGYALLLALIPVTAAALVGGSLGGSIVRKQPVRGLFFALLFAWPVAVITLPLLPAYLGWSYRGAWFCLSACNPMITSEVPLSGVLAYAQVLLFGLWGPAEVAAVLALIAYVLARRHRRGGASAFTIAAVVSLNFWSILSPGVVAAALALIVGSFVWVAPHLVAANEAAEANDEPPPSGD
jgi:hypothetical protein